jgi:predicted ATP-dependent serine protease
MEKKASDVIDMLYKLAAEKEYQKPIECEVCGYEGQPEYDGRCPECGAIGGIKPHDPASDKPYEGLVDRNLTALNYDVMSAQVDADLDTVW